MGYFKDLFNRPVQSPFQGVAVVDRNQVFQQPVRLYVERTKNAFAKFNLKVKGPDGVKYYKGKSKNMKKIIYSMNEQPILTLADGDRRTIKRKIFLGEKDNLISTINSRHSNRKYRIEYTNLFTGVKESIQMNSDKRLVVCGIFYGREQDGAPLIAKITRDSRIRTKCCLDIAPGVDNLFIIILATFFQDRGFYYNRRRRRTKPVYHPHHGYISSESDNDDDNDDHGDYDDCGYADYGDCDAGDFGGDGGDGGDCGGDGGGDGGGGD